jgi:hypothetical protein
LRDENRRKHRAIHGLQAATYARARRDQQQRKPNLTSSTRIVRPCRWLQSHAHYAGRRISLLGVSLRKQARSQRQQEAIRQSRGEQTKGPQARTSPQALCLLRRTVWQKTHLIDSWQQTRTMLAVSSSEAGNRDCLFARSESITRRSPVHGD